MGKQARHVFPRNAQLSNRDLEVIHIDVWTTKAASLGGCCYYVSFIDDHTRKLWMYFMKHKSEVFDNSQSLRPLLRREKART